MTGVQVTRGYGLLENYLNKKRCAIANRLIPPSLRNGRILDIGCGTFPRFLYSTSFAEKYGLDQVVSASNRFVKEKIYIQEFNLGSNTKLPFEDGQFRVVWSQCSLNHDEAWLREFDRVLVHGGRLALTFAIRKNNPDEYSPRWKLQEIVCLVQDLGYSIDHSEDITERDIEIGWKALDRKLSERGDEFTKTLGKDRVCSAHKKFTDEIQKMRGGKWGNGRIVATKVERLDKSL